ncbi:hypothetical protein K440DRAFT_608344 [Wilcoxina mikolae CBS 423.85]|nr:hypothetical protein K440DRAFT_608344 [Wilcoxina mikolae CBS 423.85]
MYRRHRLLDFLFVCCGLSTSHALLEHRQQTPGSRAELVCGFEGIADMYGLGIRLGVYFNAIAMLISFTFDQRSISSISFSNGLFQFSMLIGLSYITITEPDRFHLVEAAIVVMFTFCSTTPFRIDFELPRDYTLEKIQQFSRMTLIPALRKSIELALLAYSVWFWFRGIDRLSSTPCTSYGFFFARVSFFGWFRTLGKIYSIIEFSSHVLMLYLLPVLIFFEDRVPGMEEILEELRMYFRPRKSQQPRPTTAHAVYRKLNLILGVVFCILSVELMIRWNNITGVNSIASVGQMIPFLIGFGSLLTIPLDWEPTWSPNAPNSHGGGRSGNDHALHAGIY